MRCCRDRPISQCRPSTRCMPSLRDGKRLWRSCTALPMRRFRWARRCAEVTLAVLDERSAIPPSYRKTRSRAADAAWARHTGQAPGRVPEECRREVRSLKRSIEASAQAISAAINDRARWCALADAYLKRGALHRERTLAKLRQALAPADVEPRSLGAINSLLVTWLEPREGVVERVEPTFSQAAIV